MQFNLHGLLKNPSSVEPEETQSFIRGVRNATAFNAIDDERKYSGIGAVPVPVRVSIVRLALFKLLGIGVAVAVSGIGAATPSLRRSCALAAGVNFVACSYYYMIMRVRAQGLLGSLDSGPGPPPTATASQAAPARAVLARTEYSLRTASTVCRVYVSSLVAPPRRAKGSRSRLFRKIKPDARKFA